MRTHKIKNTLYIERTKDFFVQEGEENKPSFIKAIKHRESIGDKLNVCHWLNCENPRTCNIH